MKTKQSLRIIPALLVLFSCFSSAETQPTPGPETGTGLEGVITVSPIRGGPSRAGLPDSGPLANVAFAVENEKGTVTSFTTDDQGQFRISLAPGRYTVSRNGGKGGIGKFGPFEVDVVAGKMTSVQWNCDTGMR
jgi:Prealbumin-like fold domain